jgi:hypothetical protein
MNKRNPFSVTAKINRGDGSYQTQDWRIWDNERLCDGQLALLALDGLLLALRLVDNDVVKSNDDAYNIANDLGFL